MRITRLKTAPCLAAAALAAFTACSTRNRELELKYPRMIPLTVTNPSAEKRTDEMVFIDVAAIRVGHPAFNPNAFVVTCRDLEVPSQAMDSDGDGRPDGIAFVSDLGGHEKRDFLLRFDTTGVLAREYPKRTQAELSCKSGGRFVNRKYIGGEFGNVTSLRVPAEHTDHSFFIRYEGPGWESDKVGYRFYLDWRNAIDLYGKKTPDMVLQHVGLDGFESYHAMSDWGMDILKVGESLGLGTLGMWINGRAERVSVTDSVICSIADNGPVFSDIQTRYFGWKIGKAKYDLVSHLSITAGSRLTRHGIRISGNPPNLCTGLVRLDSTVVFSTAGSGGEWAYLATYGKQSLAGDSLGLAVLFRNRDFVQTAQDSNSHVVVLKPENGMLDYYLVGAWEQEPGGIRSAAEFKTYLDGQAARLGAPVVVEW
jgi:hypothetical protein